MKAQAERIWVLAESVCLRRDQFVSGAKNLGPGRDQFVLSGKNLGPGRHQFVLGGKNLGPGRDQFVSGKMYLSRVPEINPLR